jgi:hypothetical protein
MAVQVAEVHTYLARVEPQHLAKVIMAAQVLL